MFKIINISIISSFIATSSFAGVCDYRPSNLLGSIGTGAEATAGTGVAAVGMGAKAAGFYTLTHAVTGATMLGSTAGGASAAGTVGIMGGTAGLVGTVGSIIMAPTTIIAGVVIGAGTVILEGGCYFVVERVEDPIIIMEILENMAANSDPIYFKLVNKGKSNTNSADDENMSIYVALKVDDTNTVLERAEYKVKNLYIEESILKHKDYGPNTQIGKVGYVLNEEEMQN